jgi:AraC-like DNA-binding protein
MTKSNLLSPQVDVLANEYPSGFDIAPHAHDAAQIVHAASGVMRVMTEDGAWVVPPGRAIWMPRRRTHWIHCVTPLSMRTLYLKGAFSPARGDCQVWSVSPLLHEIILRLVAGADGRMHEALVALLLLEVERVDATPLHLPEPEDERLKRVTNALRAAPSDGRSLAQWSKIAGAAPRTLIRLFLKETGMSFREWRRQLRVLAALELLADGEAVTGVAYELGYATPSAFIQAFRDVLGVTPARYFANDR